MSTKARALLRMYAGKLHGGKRDIAAAAPVVAAILSSKALLAFFPRSKAELRRFAEVYPA